VQYKVVCWGCPSTEVIFSVLVSLGLEDKGTDTRELDWRFGMPMPVMIAVV
jgi:hypothetical protein